MLLVVDVMHSWEDEEEQDVMGVGLDVDKKDKMVAMDVVDETQEKMVDEEEEQEVVDVVEHKDEIKQALEVCYADHLAWKEIDEQSTRHH